MFYFKSKNKINIEYIKNITKFEEFQNKNNFFISNVNQNLRLVFNYYNFIQENNDYIDKFEILNQYFERKSLFHIKQKDKDILLNIKNIDVLPSQYSSVKQNKKVSIVLTTYNIEGLVNIAISSLVNQTYKNIEIILVDDGSTDNTFEILQKIRNAYPDKIQLIKLNQNYGTYIAKNMGMSYATSDLITFHDADDWAHPQRIEEHVKAHEKNKKVKFSISKLVRVTEEGYFFSKYIYPLDRLSMISLMIDRILIDEVGYFRKQRIGSDSEYFERLKKFTKHKFVRIDKVLMFCAHRENSLTTSIETGVNGFSTNNKRQHHWDKWNKWHDKLKKARRKPFVGFDRSKYKYEIIN